MDTIIRQLSFAFALSAFFTFLVWSIPSIRRWFDTSFFRRIGYPPFIKEVIALYAKSNPGQSWREKKVEIEGNLVDIPYPVWDCWAIFHDPGVIHRIGFQVIEKYGDLIHKGTKICAVTNPALFFLGSIDDWLRERGAIAFSLEKSYPSTRDWRETPLVLFDLNFNTGNTIIEASKFFTNLRWEPEHIIVVLYNDLVPENETYLSESGILQKLKYVFKASEIIDHWDNQEITQAVKTVQQALKNKSIWNDLPVQNSLTLLRTHPPVGVNSGYQPLGSINN